MEWGAKNFSSTRKQATPIYQELWTPFMSKQLFFLFFYCSMIIFQAFFFLMYSITKVCKTHVIRRLVDHELVLGCSMAVFGWLAGCRLASHLTESLFTFCQNSIFLSQQSAEIVFFIPGEQVFKFHWRCGAATAWLLACIPRSLLSAFGTGV